MGNLSYPIAQLEDDFMRLLTVWNCFKINGAGDFPNGSNY